MACWEKRRPPMYLAPCRRAQACLQICTPTADAGPGQRFWILAYQESIFPGATAFRQVAWSSRGACARFACQVLCMALQRMRSTLLQVLLARRDTALSSSGTGMVNSRQRRFEREWLIMRRSERVEICPSLLVSARGLLQQEWNA